MQNKRTTLTGLTVIAVALAGLSTAAVGQQRPGNGPMGPQGGAAFERIFAEIDADNDGRITKEEVEAWKAAQPKVEDTNGDGKISAEELAAPRIAEATKRAQERAARMVAELDTDGDGLLSAAELAQRPMGGPEGREGKGPDLTRIFDRLDADKDGAVTREEAQKAMAAMHDRAKGHGKERGPKGEGHGPAGHRGAPGERPLPEGQPGDDGEN